jgi:hypothetical protein
MRHAAEAAKHSHYVKEIVPTMFGLSNRNFWLRRAYVARRRILHLHLHSGGICRCFTFPTEHSHTFLSRCRLPSPLLPQRHPELLSLRASPSPQAPLGETVIAAEASCRVSGKAPLAAPGGYELSDGTDAYLVGSGDIRPMAAPCQSASGGR